MNKGAIMENRVASCLVCCGYTPYFFDNGHLEIDFIVDIGNNVTAMEIKSGTTTAPGHSVRSRKTTASSGGSSSSSLTSTWMTMV